MGTQPVPAAEPEAKGRGHAAVAHLVRRVLQVGEWGNGAGAISPCHAASAPSCNQLGQPPPDSGRGYGAASNSKLQLALHLVRDLLHRPWQPHGLETAKGTRCAVLAPFLPPRCGAEGGRRITAAWHRKHSCCINPHIRLQRCRKKGEGLCGRVACCRGQAKRTALHHTLRGLRVCVCGGGQP